MRLRKARPRDVAPLLQLINGYAARGLLLERSEESLRARLVDFSVAEVGAELLGCGALSELAPGLGEVRSLAVREDQTGRGIGRRIVQRLLEEAGERGFAEVLALTRSVPFFEALGFAVTRRERFLDKLKVDCQACPLNLCCDEVAMVRPPASRRAPGPAVRHAGAREPGRVRDQQRRVEDGGNASRASAAPLEVPDRDSPVGAAKAMAYSFLGRRERPV